MKWHNCTERLVIGLNLGSNVVFPVDYETRKCVYQLSFNRKCVVKYDVTKILEGGTFIEKQTDDCEVVKMLKTLPYQLSSYQNICIDQRNRIWYFSKDILTVGDIETEAVIFELRFN